MVKAQAGILEDDTADVVAEKLGRAVRDVVDDEPDWVEAPLAPARRRTELDAGASNRDESFTAWRTFFEALAEHRPLVLVFEDIHWADEGAAGLHRPPRGLGRGACRCSCCARRARSSSNAGPAGVAGS